MVDLVDVWRAQAEGLGWKFSVGNRANRNLLRSTLVPNEIYFLLDPVTDSEAESEMGGQGEVTYTGQFSLLVKSNLDNVYDNQKGRDKADGKYEKNIQPLKYTELPKFKKLIDCSDFTRVSWSVLGTTNLLDANMDGIVVTFTVKIL